MPGSVLVSKDTNVNSMDRVFVLRMFQIVAAANQS